MPLVKLPIKDECDTVELTQVRAPLLYVNLVAMPLVKLPIKDECDTVELTQVRASLLYG